jgi:hypothetical protein
MTVNPRGISRRIRCRIFSTTDGIRPEMSRAYGARVARRSIKAMEIKYELPESPMGVT